MSKKASKVFISHHSDDESLATTLRNLLEEERIEAFMFQKVKRYELLIIQKIMDEISERDCLVAIFTRKGMSSSSVNQEIGFALGKDKPVIVMTEKEIEKVEGVFMHGREFVEFTKPTFSQACLEVRQHLLDLDNIGKRSKTENKPTLLIEEAKSGVVDEKRVGYEPQVGEYLSLSATFRNQSTAEEIRDLVFYAKEVDTKDLDSIIKQEAQIMTNPQPGRNVVQGDTITFHTKIDWKEPKSKGIALIAIWFEYKYSEDEKEEGIVVLECSRVKFTLQNMNKERYSGLEIRQARDKQQDAQMKGNSNNVRSLY